MKKYYLAYGSNLNLNQMKYRCPTAVAAGTYYLKGYSLEFRCYLTIVKDENGVVPLGIFELDDEEERYLDRYEGYPILYRKEIFKVKLNDDNKEIEALIYIMNDGQYPKIKPSKRYLDTCLEGYKDFGFDNKYLLEALEKFK